MLGSRSRPSSRPKPGAERSAADWARWQRQQAKARTGRTATIAALIERGIAECGLAPTDAELAGLLACSPERIAHHRKLLEL